MARELLLQRLYRDAKSSIGYMMDLTEKLLLGFTCEDEKREVKVAKETRIWAGRYRIVIQEVVTDKTKDYRERYSWFDKHIMVEGVKDFQGIYIHIGNSEKDTDGCLLMGDLLGNLAVAKYADGKPVGESTVCFERFYKKYYPLLKAGKEVYLTVKDETY